MRNDARERILASLAETEPEKAVHLALGKPAHRRESPLREQALNEVAGLRGAQAETLKSDAPDDPPSSQP